MNERKRRCACRNAACFPIAEVICRAGRESMPVQQVVAKCPIMRGEFGTLDTRSALNPANAARSYAVANVPQGLFPLIPGYGFAEASLHQRWRACFTPKQRS